MTIKFLHIYCINESKTLTNDPQIVPKDGLTIAYTGDKTLGIMIQIAKCHPHDVYSERVGEQLAQERLRSDGPLDFIDWDDDVEAALVWWAEDFYSIEIVRHNIKWCSDFMEVIYEDDEEDIVESDILEEPPMQTP